GRAGGIGRWRGVDPRSGSFRGGGDPGAGPGARSFDEVFNERPSRQSLTQSCPTQQGIGRSCPSGGGARRCPRPCPRQSGPIECGTRQSCPSGRCLRRLLGRGGAGAAQGGVIEMDIDLHPGSRHAATTPMRPLTPVLAIPVLAIPVLAIPVLPGRLVVVVVV